MKKIILLALALSASQVFAQAITDSDICKGQASKKVTIGGASGAVVNNATFIRTGFEFQCSNNVFLYAKEETATLLTVGAASAKGNQYFGGSSNGGSITGIGKCAKDPCDETDAKAGSTAAKGKAS